MPIGFICRRHCISETASAGEEWRISCSHSRVNGKEWEPVTRVGLLRFGAGLGLLFLLWVQSEPGFILIVDHANLLFHEAGHPLIGFFSARLAPYGGTLGQLAFPMILAVKFWQRDQPLATAGAAIWFFENWLNIARYMADARTLALPLVGGDDHDWNTIFHQWDVLIYDTRIACVVRLLGWAGIVSACAWVTWRAFLDRNRVSDQRQFQKPDRGLAG